MRKWYDESVWEGTGLIRAVIGAGHDGDWG